jgi:hypothetical protein
MIRFDAPGRLSWVRSPSGLLLLAIVALAAVYAVAEHGDHLVALLPFAFILLCPLMHLFMHGGHGGHDHANQHQRSER